MRIYKKGVVPIDNFGSRLKERRKEKMISQKYLSEKLGVALSTLSQYETNKRRPNFKILSEICGILDVSGDWLLGITPPENKVTLDNQIDYLRNFDAPVKRDSYEEVLISMTSNMINTGKNKDYHAMEILHNLYETIADIKINYQSSNAVDPLDDILSEHIATKEKIDHLLNMLFKHHISMNNKLEETTIVETIEVDVAQTPTIETESFVEALDHEVGELLISEE